MSSFSRPFSFSNFLLNNIFSFILLFLLLFLINNNDNNFERINSRLQKTEENISNLNKNEKNLELFISNNFNKILEIVNHVSTDNIIDKLFEIGRDNLINKEVVIETIFEIHNDDKELLSEIKNDIEYVKEFTFKNIKNVIGMIESLKYNPETEVQYNYFETKILISSIKKDILNMLKNYFQENNNKYQGNDEIVIKEEQQQEEKVEEIEQELDQKKNIENELKKELSEDPGYLTINNNNNKYQKEIDQEYEEEMVGINTDIDFDVVGNFDEKTKIYDYHNLKYNYKAKKNIPKDKKKFLITGVGRSGTSFIKTAFKLHNINVKHEDVDSQIRGSVSWPYAVESNNYPWGNAPENINKNGYLNFFDIVLHQVRDPEKVVASVTTFGMSSINFINDFIRNDSRTGEKFEVKQYHNQKIRLAMAYYIDWNLFVEKIASYRYQIEHTPFEDICRLSGVKEEECFSEIIPSLPIIEKDRYENGEINHREHLEYKFSDYFDVDYDLALELYEMGLKYGYTYNFEIPERSVP
eukprot:TRINITY_DN4913_c0_g1_i1.p1 TRINITY_DN4913_c0_g1~~TRINITY_DN4913_c0_g1_i1.p1  ORF type:complete len:548 (-),score=125.73 TRINITY_DN4913_c0_g1_i1:57-1634(-)